MSIWDFWKAEAKDYLFGQVETSRAPAGLNLAPILPDAAYLRVTLRRMRIVNVRVGSNKFYAAVHADLGLWHDSGRFINFKQVVTPSELKDVSAASLDRTIVRDQVLLGPTPYRGGPLQLNFALLSVKSSNLAGPYLEVLSGLSGLAGVSYIKAAEPFLQPIAQGINLLFGVADAAAREVQVIANLDPVEPGVFVVLRATADEVNLAELRIANDWALLENSGMPLSGYPYAVFSVEALSQKYDWKGIPDVKAAYDRVADAARKDDATGYREGLAAFRRATYLSDDLLMPHAKELVTQVEDKLGSLFVATMTARRGEEEKRVPGLEAYEPFRTGTL